MDRLEQDQSRLCSSSNGKSKILNLTLRAASRSTRHKILDDLTRCRTNRFISNPNSNPNSNFNLYLEEKLRFEDWNNFVYPGKKHSKNRKDPTVYNLLHTALLLLIKPTYHSLFICLCKQLLAVWTISSSELNLTVLNFRIKISNDCGEQFHRADWADFTK